MTNPSKKICKWCNGELTRGQKAYCSVKCSALGRSGTQKSLPLCAVCNVALERRSRKYCTMECRDKASRTRARRAISDGYQVCSKCHKRKSVDDFDTHTQRVAGIRPDCMECRQQGVVNRPGSQEKARRVALGTNYNITLEEYEAIFDAQGRVCAVCLRPKRDTEKNFAVDHDHVSHLIRGILCPSCNLRIIGKHRKPEVFRRAADYLESPPARDIVGDRQALNRPRKRKPRRKRS